MAPFGPTAHPARSSQANCASREKLPTQARVPFLPALASNMGALRLRTKSRY